MQLDPLDIRRDLGNPELSRESKLRAVARQYEAVFIGQLFKEMRNTVPKVGLTGEDKFATQIYQEMWDGEVAKAASEGQGLGLADMIYKQMAPAYLSQKPGIGEKGAVAGDPDQLLGRLQALKAAASADAARAAGANLSAGGPQ